MQFFCILWDVLLGGVLDLHGRGGEGNLGGFFHVLYLVGDVDCGTGGSGGEGCDHGSDEDECNEAPGDLFEDVGGLAHAECLVACHEIAGEALALAVLEQNHSDEQDCRKDEEDNEDCENNVHIVNSCLFRQ